MSPFLIFGIVLFSFVAGMCIESFLDGGAKGDLETELFRTQIENERLKRGGRC